MGVRSCWREERVSAKNGSKYQVLCVEFENGYVFESFLKREESFILKDVELLK